MRCRLSQRHASNLECSMELSIVVFLSDENGGSEQTHYKIITRTEYICKNQVMDISFLCSYNKQDRTEVHTTHSSKWVAQENATEENAMPSDLGGGGAGIC